jgi:alpha-L-fucosidase 2
VSFTNLRAEGGFKVSAKRAAGKTAEVRVEATVDGPLRLRDPFGGATATWNRRDLERDGEDYVVTLKNGDVLIGTRK